MISFGQIWHLWCDALGAKASDDNLHADRVAIIRTVIFLSYILTNTFIVAGVVRHWNDNRPVAVEQD